MSQVDESEEWRPVVDYEGVYEVSSTGRVRRVMPCKGAKVGRILKPWGKQYPIVQLRVRDERKKKFYVHELVAEAFHGRRPDRHEVNHIDGDKGNAAAKNLEWVTSGGNKRHAYSIGLITPGDGKSGRTPEMWFPKGDKHPKAKLTKAQVQEIIALKGKVPLRELAERFGMNRKYLSRLQNGHFWKHLDYGSVA